MGAAAYNRGSKAIRAQIITPPMRDSIYASIDAELQAAYRERDRAIRSLRSVAATLTQERQRARAAVAELERIREEFRGTGASKAHYIAILAVLRAKKALGLA